MRWQTAVDAINRKFSTPLEILTMLRSLALRLSPVAFLVGTMLQYLYYTVEIDLQKCAIITRMKGQFDDIITEYTLRVDSTEHSCSGFSV